MGALSRALATTGPPLGWWIRRSATSSSFGVGHLQGLALATAGEEAGILDTVTNSLFFPALADGEPGRGYFQPAGPAAPGEELLGLPQDLKSTRFPQSDAIMSRLISFNIRITWTEKELDEMLDRMEAALHKVLQGVKA